MENYHTPVLIFFNLIEGNNRKQMRNEMSVLRYRRTACNGMPADARIRSVAHAQTDGVVS